MSIPSRMAPSMSVRSSPYPIGPCSISSAGSPAGAGVGIHAAHLWKSETLQQGGIAASSARWHDGVSVGALAAPRAETQVQEVSSPAHFELARAREEDVAASTIGRHARRKPLPCRCPLCEAGTSPLALTLGDLHARKQCAEFAGRCSGCNEQLLGRPIAKGGENALWQCEECAQEHQRQEFAEKAVLEVIRQRNTPEQDAILNWLRWGPRGSSLVIEAKAGSGKTTTICRGYLEVEDARRGGAIFIAFNAAIVQELRRRGMPSKTAHAIGWRAWMQAHPQLMCVPAAGDSRPPPKDDSASSSASEGEGEKIESQERKLPYLTSSKISCILAKLYTPQPDSQGRKPKAKDGLTKGMRGFVKRLVSVAKNHGLGVDGCAPNNEDEFEHLAHHYGFKSLLVDPKNKSQTEASLRQEFRKGLGHAQEVLQMSIALALTSPKQGGMFDFDDQLYMPLLQDLALCDRRRAPDGYAFIFVDEAQDMNPTRIEMVRRLARANGSTRVIAVGDPLQAIYGFTGAEQEALQKLGSMFKAETLPLSITWRCPRSHVDLANRIMQRWGRLEGSAPMKARPDAEQGVIVGRWWDWTELTATPEVTFANFPLAGARDAAVVCRTNAPLLLLHYKLVARGIPSHLKGRREVRAELLGLLIAAVRGRERASRWTVSSLETALCRHVEASKDRANFSAQQHARKEDLLECIKFLLGQISNTLGDAIADLRSEIDRVFRASSSMRGPTHHLRVNRCCVSCNFFWATHRRWLHQLLRLIDSLMW